MSWCAHFIKQQELYWRCMTKINTKIKNICPSFILDPQAMDTMSI